MTRQKENLLLRSRRAFTLLEVMIAIVLLILVSGVLSYKMHGAIGKKRFESDVERLKARMVVAQKLAVSMQADWSGELKKQDKDWIFSVQCDEVNGKRFKPLHLTNLEVLLDGKKIKSGLAFDFFSSGHTAPSGILVFERNLERHAFHMMDLFQREEGTKLGPLHPNQSM